MGKEIERVALERGDRILATVNSHSPPLSADLASNADVAIHNATPGSVPGHVEQWAGWGKPMVIGTTGWQAELNSVRKTVENKGTGLVYASNFSIGVNILFSLIRQAGTLFDKLPEYDALIHEIHHKDKLDSPSGTALTLADHLMRHLRRKKEVLSGTPQGKIKPEQLQVTSARGGSVVGTHHITFDSAGDMLEIIHTAKNRQGFARGALLAADWIQGKKGFFTMEDVLNDLLKG